MHVLFPVPTLDLLNQTLGLGLNGLELPDLPTLSTPSKQDGMWLISFPFRELVQSSLSSGWDDNRCGHLVSPAPHPVPGAQQMLHKLSRVWEAQMGSFVLKGGEQTPSIRGSWAPPSTSLLLFQGLYWSIRSEKLESAV